MTENSVKRKLRAILAADVKGYSRMMGEDEVGTYQTLTSYLESIRSIISDHNGRVFSSPGDAVMAEFSSVVDAVSHRRQPGRCYRKGRAGIWRWSQHRRKD